MGLANTAPPASASSSTPPAIPITCVLFIEISWRQPPALAVRRSQMVARRRFWLPIAKYVNLCYNEHRCAEGIQLDAVEETVCTLTFSIRGVGTEKAAVP